MDLKELYAIYGQLMIEVELLNNRAVATKNKIAEELRKVNRFPQQRIEERKVAKELKTEEKEGKKEKEVKKEESKKSRGK